mmetsp:Transcript_22730/g.53891  ORF Transcript_22730/g.53891 Transcript_22730/m.53891 type:complete len:786 (+) Transcript_22730:251-2608(+)
MSINHRRRQFVPAVVVVVNAVTITGFMLSLVVVYSIRLGIGSNGRSNQLLPTPFLSPIPPLPCQSLSSSRSSRMRLFDSQSPRDAREEEIREKIEKLKEEGRLGKAQASSEAASDSTDTPRKSAYDDYANKVQGKLGKRQGQLLGFTGDGTEKCGSKTSSKEKNKEYSVDDFIAAEEKADAVELNSARTLDEPEQDDRGRQLAKIDGRGRRVATIGSLPEELLPPKEPETLTSTSSSEEGATININPAIFDIPEKDEQEPPEMTEEELVELVAERLAEKRAVEDAAIEAAAKARREKARQAEESSVTTGEQGDSEESTSSGTKMTTSGVGGSWKKTESEPEADYKPKVGGWGVFPRPKSISEAYGGGRRIGAGYDKVDDEAQKLNTQRLLKDYRKKIGIEVPSEKEHAAEIEEALSIGQRAMQRGVYGTAVSALEKVTKWCSTNSKVGSKVYLELAMAYEAVGRTKEASQVYKTLTECRMEDVKYNAKRLLYGLEAMEVMKSVSSDFTRKKTRNAFIDATGLDNIASKFDDVYQTAYVDLDNGFYKKLTESVVRSTREARQILVQAQGKGEVSRTRIVQALRCLSRQFDDMLQSEINSSVSQEPTAYLNGKPIERGPLESSVYGSSIGSLGDFTLLNAKEMLQQIDGEWKLQLLADRSGDGVSFFNTTSAVQKFCIDDMTFSATGPSGLGTENCSGSIMMDDSKRVLSKDKIDSSNIGVGGILSVITGGKNSGFSAAVSRKQQIVSVDSLLLITRRARGSSKSGDLDKEYFGVWRRVTPQDDFMF